MAAEFKPGDTVYVWACPRGGAYPAKATVVWTTDSGMVRARTDSGYHVVCAPKEVFRTASDLVDARHTILRREYDANMDDLFRWLKEQEGAGDGS
jgi:hypothetical protein